MLKESKIPADDVLFNELQVKYNQQFNLSWVGLYGFNNTYGLAVRKDLADKYNIHIQILQSTLKNLVLELNVIFMNVMMVLILYVRNMTWNLKYCRLRYWVKI